MGDISENFNRSEFACKCSCGFDDVSAGLVAAVQEIRDHFQSPIKINSSCRCKEHNKSVGGARKSKHLEGIAADVVVIGIEPSVVHRYLLDKYPNDHGIGKYNTFTHLDVRTSKARW